MLRLNTYDTLPVSKLDKKAVEASKKASVVAVASPSAVQAWVQLIGSQKDANVAFACIGWAPLRITCISFLNCVGLPSSADCV